MPIDEVLENLTDAEIIDIEEKIEEEIIEEIKLKTVKEMKQYMDKKGMYLACTDDCDDLITESYINMRLLETIGNPNKLEIISKESGEPIEEIKKMIADDPLTQMFEDPKKMHDIMKNYKK
jgi:hypothetical protein